MSAANLLDRLERVKPTGPGRWIAPCPVHKDKTPSLSIRELDDGRILLYDFGGCSTEDVLKALGLTLSDLFPERLAGAARGFAPSQSRIPARDLFEILDHEIVVAVFILDDIVKRRTVNESQLQRLCQSAARIGKARDLVNPAKVTPR